jgi:hypothetical protein
MATWHGRIIAVEIKNRPRTVSDISSHGGIDFAQHEDHYLKSGEKSVSGLLG